MATKAEGIWGCTVLSGLAGKDGDNVVVQINVQIDEGPSKGMRGTYEETVDNRSRPYVEKSCAAVGWGGKLFSTLHDDIVKWIAATGGKTTCEVKHIAIKRGKQYDKWVADGMKDPAPVWDKIKGLGRGAARQLEPLNEKDETALIGGFDATEPPPADGDIPFITNSMALEVKP